MDSNDLGLAADCERERYGARPVSPAETRRGSVAPRPGGEIVAACEDDPLMTERTRVLIEIDEPMGPGVDFEPNVDGIGSTARRARVRGPWLGLDRGHLVDADDGSGREVPVLVALPASTFAGCRIEGELVGGLAAQGGSVLVARINGAALPIEPFIRTVAGRLASEGSWMSAQGAARHAERARREYRERRAKERVVGGRAWLPEGSEAPDKARFSTPHSLSEYSLARLPPRFMRGLEGLLDPDERILYWIERPALVDTGARGPGSGSEGPTRRDAAPDRSPGGMAGRPRHTRSLPLRLGSGRHHHPGRAARRPRGDDATGRDGPGGADGARRDGGTAAARAIVGG